MQNNFFIVVLLSLSLIGCSTNTSEQPVSKSTITAAQQTELTNISGNLDHEFANTRVEVVQVGDHIRLILPSYYIFNRKGAITPYIDNVLKNIAHTAIANKYQEVIVYAYTSHDGGMAENQSLSTGWANKVKAALIAKGITADKITAAGRGEFFPIASNYTFSGRLKNRRVEILLFLSAR